MVIQRLVMVSTNLTSCCGYTWGHRSILGPPVRLIHFAVDSETAMASRFASRCDLSCLIVPRTTADARSSSSLLPRIKDVAKVESSTAHDQLPGLQTPKAFHKARATCRFKLRLGRIEYSYVQEVPSLPISTISVSCKGRSAIGGGDGIVRTSECCNKVAMSLND